MHNVGTAYLVR